MCMGDQDYALEAVCGVRGANPTLYSRLSHAPAPRSSHPHHSHYTVKKAFRYSRPHAAGMSLAKLFLGRNNDVIDKLFPPRESLVSDIPAGDRKIVKLFYGV